MDKESLIDSIVEELKKIENKEWILFTGIWIGFC